MAKAALLVVVVDMPDIRPQNSASGISSTDAAVSRISSSFKLRLLGGTADNRVSTDTANSAGMPMIRAQRA
ncbi:hypothetical protein GCM10009422_20510 [Brevundimonas kwangchunensis]|uniref:Uncharacterized protein n=1 Tax=Brevundimonas kwangchunensis TaxID=322163 RepID=A0ABP3S276_9CAUL